ncbi:MAG: hypothetical protein PF485_13060 [Bacteroidales bacterium]|jgi:hypothetical protein|nr:hypothetical protein [Bacteroidales bacterium]
MNKQYYVILFLFISLLFSCEKDDSGNSIAECDVNGVWIGEWESNLQITGTFCANVTQNLTDFSGYICIRLDEPSTENYNRDFEGTVKSKNVRTIMTIQGVEIAAEGDITDDALVSGNFNVPDLSMHGTFDGKKIPTTEANLTEIYSSPTGVVEHISDFIYIENSLWIIMYSDDCWEDGPKTKIHKYDLTGNLIETICFDAILSSNVSSDGQYIWELYNGTTISKFDTDGLKIDSIDVPNTLHCYKIACSTTNLFLFTGSKIHETDYSLNVLDSINPRYNFPESYAAYQDYHLYSSGNVIYKMNTDQEIIRAYVFPSEWRITDIETNGTKVWCFVNWYDENASDEMFPFRYTIYEIDLN